VNRAPQPRSGLFELLSHDEKKEAIRKMARQGFGDHTISSLTAMHVNWVRAIIGDRTLLDGQPQ